MLVHQGDGSGTPTEPHHTLCTSLQRQHSELLAKFQALEEEILRLKERVQVLEERDSVAAKHSGDDAPIKGRNINEGETAAERISNDLEEVVRVLTSMDAATVLARGIDVPTGSGSILATEKANDQEAEEGILYGYDQKQLRVKGKRF
nr:hypothetical protein [Tanacetum cinerariifolium]